MSACTIRSSITRLRAQKIMAQQCTTWIKDAPTELEKMRNEREKVNEDLATTLKEEAMKERVVALVCAFVM